ncbi:uncharacterized protein LOC119683710 [Teleopsis dalmanni]|uniref:uncharacterized protein LOC119683710 n=1 Tax=Teleopsis dalmanni TaxID=139649 RepID=UPI0018CF0DBC|nr:uncharacterized protein LOC119683710 [Teleopsis dalmanni]
MPIGRAVITYLDELFSEHHIWIALQSFLVLVTLGFFHYQLESNQCDLMCWIKTIEENIDNIFYMLSLLNMLLVVGVPYYIIELVTRANCKLILSEVKVLQKRYATYIFIQLMARIDEIYDKLPQIATNEQQSDADLILNEQVIEAREKLIDVINDFKQKAIKLYSISEEEASTPFEDLYFINENDSKLAPYYEMKISVDLDFISFLMHRDFVYIN